MILIFHLPLRVLRTAVLTVAPFALRLFICVSHLPFCLVFAASLINSSWHAVLFCLCRCAGHARPPLPDTVGPPRTYGIRFRC